MAARVRTPISRAPSAGKACSPDFRCPCWANAVQARLRSSRGPPGGHFRRGDSGRGGRHPCSRAERRLDLAAREYGLSSRFNRVSRPRQKANRAAALRFEQAGCARRARKGRAARCSRAGKRRGPAQGTDDAIGTAGCDANVRIDAARAISSARGSEHAIRPGRATSTPRDDGRSVGGAGADASSGIALDDAAALGAGQGDRHRLAGALERGSFTRAVAGCAPAAWCRPRGRGGTSRGHG